jgi:diaminopimelate epimerase
MKRLVPFEKYEATGNDFIIFDFMDFELFDLNNRELIKLLCDRHFGIGADGLIALKREVDSDFRMKYFNSDGRLSSFCGNGSRASVKFMASKHSQTTFGFMAEDGAHYGRIQDNLISVKMKDINSIENTPHGKLIDSGSPHLIVEVEDPWNYPVNEEGKRLRNLFGDEGVNVNFISRQNGGIKIATYERGVEWETLACGTGVTAAAYFICIVNRFNGLNQIRVEAKGGTLGVSLDLNDTDATDIWLSGDAKKVFSGFYEMD